MPRAECQDAQRILAQSKPRFRLCVSRTAGRVGEEIPAHHPCLSSTFLVDGPKLRGRPSSILIDSFLAPFLDLCYPKVSSRVFNAPANAEQTVRCSTRRRGLHAVCSLKAPIEWEEALAGPRSLDRLGLHGPPEGQRVRISRVASLSRSPY